MTTPRRQYDAYAGHQRINTATLHPVTFDVRYQHQTDPLAVLSRTGLLPGQCGYRSAGWYWVTETADFAGPFVSSRAAFRDAVATLTRKQVSIRSESHE